METLMRPALIIGAAECVEEDMANLIDLIGGSLENAFTIFGVNDGGVLWTGRLDHWCTLHPDELPERAERRREEGGEDGYDVWTPDRVHPDYRIDGFTSAGLACGVARSVGHERQVMVGCPMTNMGYAVNHMHHGDGPWPYWRTYEEAMPSILKQHSWLKEEVRSMSGETRAALGAPTRAWLGLKED